MESRKQKRIRDLRDIFVEIVQNHPNGISLSQLRFRVDEILDLQLACAQLSLPKNMLQLLRLSDWSDLFFLKERIKNDWWVHPPRQNGREIKGKTSTKKEEIPQTNANSAKAKTTPKPTTTHNTLPKLNNSFMHPVEITPTVKPAVLPTINHSPPSKSTRTVPVRIAELIVDHHEVFMVKTTTTSAQAFNHIFSAGTFAFDSEGDLRPGGTLALVQLGVPQVAHLDPTDPSGIPQILGSRVYIYDLIAPESPESRAIMVSHLKSLLESKDIVKVVHDGRADVDALFHLEGIQVSGPLIDTQIQFALFEAIQTPMRDLASAFPGDTRGLLDSLDRISSIIRQTVSDPSNAFPRGGKAKPIEEEAGEQSPIVDQRASLNVMLRKCGLPGNPHKEKGHNAMDKDSQVWMRRPLRHELMLYAAADVTQLLRANAFMTESLAKEQNRMMMRISEECIDEFRKCYVRSHSFVGTASPAPTSYGISHREEVPTNVEVFLSFTPEFIPKFSLTRPALPENEEEKGEEEAPELPESGNTNQEELERLFSVLPAEIVEAVCVQAENKLESIVELVMDAGRRPHLLMHDSTTIPLERLTPVTLEQLEEIQKVLPEFARDNRSGVSNTLHRISRIVNRSDLITGLTLRIGRSVQGAAAMFADLARKPQSMLVLGKPGSGKTTILRDLIRILANEMHQRVVIVDTSNEIAGDGDVPHAAIGGARRLQVKDRIDQHKVMIEAVQNHTPQVIVIDEIGTKVEAQAAKSIAQRGVKMVATAHGSLGELMKNSELNSMVGGIQPVILSAKEAEKRGREKKSVLERAGAPTFPIVIELRGPTEAAIFENVAERVDQLLAGKRKMLVTQVRWREGELFKARFETFVAPVSTPTK